MPSWIALWNFIVTFSALSAICSILSTVILIYRLCSHTISKKLNKRIVFGSIVTSICFSISASCHCIFNLYCTKIGWNVSSETSRANVTISFMSIYIMFWALGIVSLYLLLIWRLDLTFRGSMFKMHCSIYCILYILLISFCLLSMSDVISFTLVSLDVHHHFLPSNIDYFVYSEWAVRILIAAECVHIVMAVILSYLFVSRLMQLVYAMTKNNLLEYSYGATTSPTNIPGDSTNTPSSNTTSSGSMSRSAELRKSTEVHFTDKEETLLNVASKQSVLSLLVIISSQICFVATVLFTLGIDDFVEDQYRWSKLFLAVVISVDCVLNCVCILLTFSFQNGTYVCLCGKCHDCCQRQCKRTVRRKLQCNMKQMNCRLLSAGIDPNVELSSSKGLVV